MKSLPALGLLFATSILLATATSCDRKEKVLDVETPGGGIQVEQDKDTGSISVEVDEKER